MTAELIRWADAAHLANRHLSEDLRAALEPLASEEVVHLALPYGEKVIANGEFRWDLLGAQADWRSGYASKIPVALVASKTVELYDVISHHAKDEDGDPIVVRRSVPLFMTVAGQFFGLFENFAGYASSASLRGTAGGTTLVALPALGTQRNIENFLLGLGISLDEDQLREAAHHLQFKNSSKMTFGPFVRDVLAHQECEWRCDLLVLSPRFVSAISASAAADLAIKTMTLAQLAVSHRRADQTLGVFERVKASGVATTAEIQALHLLADGSRPGFHPILNTPEDEEVLPAVALDAIVFGCEDPDDEEGARPLDPERHFPIFFRPSLPGEPSFYFLGRPFIKSPDLRKASSETRVSSMLKKMAGWKTGSFWHATPRELEAWLIDLTGGGAERPIHLPSANSPFFRLGVVGFTPAPTAQDGQA